MCLTTTRFCYLSGSNISWQVSFQYFPFKVNWNKQKMRNIFSRHKSWKIHSSQMSKKIACRPNLWRKKYFQHLDDDTRWRGWTCRDLHNEVVFTLYVLHWYCYVMPTEAFVWKGLYIGIMFINSCLLTFLYSSKWKFEFTGPDQILEFIFIYF